MNKSINPFYEEPVVLGPGPGNPPNKISVIGNATTTDFNPLDYLTKTPATIQDGLDSWSHEQRDRVADETISRIERLCGKDAVPEVIEELKKCHEEPIIYEWEIEGKRYWMSKEEADMQKTLDLMEYRKIFGEKGTYKI